MELVSRTVTLIWAGMSMVCVRKSVNQLSDSIDKTFFTQHGQNLRDELRVCDSDPVSLSRKKFKMQKKLAKDNV